jgi:hypothetical protein
MRNSQQISKEEIELEQKLTELKKEKIEATRREKQYELMTRLSNMTLKEVRKIPDSELARKCRDTRLLDLFSVIGQKLNFQVLIPTELGIQSLAQVLFILDHIDDDATLNAIGDEAVTA